MYTKSDLEKKNKSSSKVVEYYKSGKKKSEKVRVETADNKRIRIGIAWYESGELAGWGIDGEGPYYQQSFFKNGRIHNIENQGKYSVEYYENGQLKEEFFQDSVYQYSKSYYQNGQIIRACKIWRHNPVKQPRDWVYIGPCKGYYENGKTRLEGTYSEKLPANPTEYRCPFDDNCRDNRGIRIGKWKFYDDKGKLTHINTYDSKGALISKKTL